MKAARESDLEVRVREHIELLGERRLSASTIAHRRLYLQRLLAWCREREVETATQLTRTLLVEDLGWLSSQTPMTSRMLRDHLIAVRVFCRWLAREGHIESDPSEVLDLPREKRSLPRSLTEEEVELVLSQPDVRTFWGLRARAAMEVLYATGMRRGELLELCWSDVDRAGETVLVREGKGRKDRVIPISERALAWLARYSERLKRPGDRVFPMTAGGLGNLIQRQLEAAGIRGKGQCHAFRHTAATLMLEHGADTRAIQEMLGHAKLRTTQVYTKVSIQELRDVHRRTHPGRH